MRKLTSAALALPLAAAVALIAFHLGASKPNYDRMQGRSAVVPSVGATPPVPRPPSPSARSDPPSPGPVWGGAAREFVQAFLDTASDRTARLDGIASPRLAELLARTDPGKVPRGTPVGSPQVANITGSVITVTQQLSDGSQFEFDLVPDVAKRDGWVVTSVRPGDR